MKKIAIGTLNSKYVHASLSPWCLRAGVEAYSAVKVETKIIEATINQPITTLLDVIVEEQFDFLSLSCYIWNIEQTKELVTLVRERFPSLPILLGGPEVSFNQREVLEDCPAVDFILSGEGEKPMAQMMEALFGDRELSQVEGLSYRDQCHQGEILENPPYFPTQEPPSPYCQDYFDHLQGKISYMESSRGCPFSCAFCLSGQGQNVRFFDLDRVKKDIVALANSGTKTVKFIDRTFNSKVSHANAILQFILEEYDNTIPTTVCFHFELAGDILKDSTLDLIEAMPKGYVQLEIGMQSFCEKTLEAVGRTTHIPTLVANIQRLVAMKNHHLHIDLIAGLPYEDVAEFEKSFNIGYNLGADMLQMGFLKVLKGSEIGLNPARFPCEYENTPPYQVISTPWLSREDMAQLEKIEDCVDRLYNSGRFTHTLAYVLDATGDTPFRLLDRVAKGLSMEKFPSLDAYVDDVFRLFQSMEGVDAQVLRDKMVRDRVETNSTGNIPKSLMVKDPDLRRLKIALEQNPDTATPPEGKRFVGILYSENLGIYVDYPKKKKEHQHFVERFLVKEVSLDCLTVVQEDQEEQEEN